MNIYTQKKRKVSILKRKTKNKRVDIETVYSISHLHEFEIPEKK